MSASTNETATGAVQTAATSDPAVHSTDGRVAETRDAQSLPDEKHVRRPRRTRRTKRDFDTAAETNLATTELESSPAPPAAKKPTAADRPGSDSQGTATEEETPLIDIDLKHADDPQYASKLAPKVHKFLRHFETQVLPGTDAPLQPAKSWPDLRTLRTRFINGMFHINLDRKVHPPLRLPTDTIHLAVYYMDRFLERYSQRAEVKLAPITTTALFMASKYEDVEPLLLQQLSRTSFGRRTTEAEALKLEVLLHKILNIMTGPTITAFAHRYLQAVDLELNLEVVHTARYFCGLGLADYFLSGQYYSKIATAAVFIAYNKHIVNKSPSEAAAQDGHPPEVEYPAGLREHSGYSIKEIVPVAKELLRVASDVHNMALTTPQPRIRASYRDALPVDVYEYYAKVDVVEMETMPDFDQYFSSLMAGQGATCSEKETETATNSATSAEAKENPEDEAESA